MGNNGTGQGDRIGHAAITFTLPTELLEHLLAEARAAGRAAALELIEKEGARADSPAPIVRYMRVSDYAKHRALSRRAVHTLLAAGLPAAGVGRLRRIDVEAADRWLASR